VRAGAASRKGMRAVATSDQRLGVRTGSAPTSRMLAPSSSRERTARTTPSAPARPAAHRLDEGRRAAEAGEVRASAGPPS
jgi:hypothetical protein